VGVQTWIGIVVVFVVLGLLVLNTGRAAREGSYRRGVGWYMDVKTPREVVMGRESAPLPRERTPGWVLGLWTVSGVASLLGAVVAWVLGAAGLAILLAVCGVGLVALAWDARRRNRKIGSARETEA
jgi:hypothetical protein